MDSAQPLNGGGRRVPAWLSYAAGAGYAGGEFWRARNQIGP